MKPLVSVIVPVYNSISYIRECMDSIVSQTLRELEIIPVDAGSTDGTAEILQDYADKDSRIKLIQTDKKSMGYQTNLGIASATGEYIGFCEADDYLALTMYERLYHIISKNQLDFIKSDFDMFIEQEKKIFLNYHIMDSEKAHLYNSILYPMDFQEVMLRDVNMWNGLYSRDFIVRNNIKLNETPKAAFQDIGFILQTFAFAKRIMYVQEEANRYRRDNAGSSVYNQNGLLFLVWEFEYAYIFLSSQKDQNQQFLAAVFKRFLSSFSEYYGKLPQNSELTNEILEAIVAFKKILRNFYGMLEYNGQTFAELDMSLDLKLLLEDNPFFDEYRRQLAELNKNHFQCFFREICRHPRTVIFGAGECGQTCYVMLKKNGYSGTICFCDNNEYLWNKKQMGLRILPAEEVLASEPGDIFFIIANVKQWKEIYQQLLSLHVKESNICKSICIGPHVSFEIDLHNST